MYLTLISRDLDTNSCVMCISDTVRSTESPPMAATSTVHVVPAAAEHGPTAAGSGTDTEPVRTCRPVHYMHAHTNARMDPCANATAPARRMPGGAPPWLTLARLCTTAAGAAAIGPLGRVLRSSAPLQVSEIISSYANGMAGEAERTFYNGIWKSATHAAGGFGTGVAGTKLSPLVVDSLHQLGARAGGPAARRIYMRQSEIGSSTGQHRCGVNCMVGCGGPHAGRGGRTMGWHSKPQAGTGSSRRWAIVSHDTIIMGHVRGMTTQRRSSCTWRLQGGSAGW